MIDKGHIDNATNALLNSNYTIVLTGAGISVESGIPPFRGEGGLWTKYDPSLFTLSYFMNNPEHSWEVLKKIFYESFKNMKPNIAHVILSIMERKGYLKTIITQNIDGLHQAAGSRNVIEYHGGIDYLTCLKCRTKYRVNEKILEKNPPKCKCGGVLKPNIVFFEEIIPEEVLSAVAEEVSMAELLMVIGTTAEIYPAAQIPYEVKRKGGNIIEINPNPSAITETLTDIFIQAKATEALSEIGKKLKII